MSAPGWKTYRDFFLKIQPAEGGQYQVEAQGPAGEGKTTFVLPFNNLELENFLLKVSRPQRDICRSADIPKPVEPMVDFGNKLFNAVFKDSVRDVFISARNEAVDKDYGLRLRLRLVDAPELAYLPWEFLCNGQDFLALSNDSILVRYIDLPRPPRSLPVSLPLRILVTLSAPNDQPELDEAKERSKIEEALEVMTRDNKIELDFTQDATITTLQRTLRKARAQGKPYHIWHYIGHGLFDPLEGIGFLAMCDPGKKTDFRNGCQLGTLFKSYPEIRLVLLNACEGARNSNQDPYSGVATALVERDIPAVIGMQCRFTDKAAIVFSEEFYAALVDGLPVDAALTEARRAVYFMPNWIEWATPVLFMRSKNGILFKFHSPLREKRVVEEPSLAKAETPLNLGTVEKNLDKQKTDQDELGKRVPTIKTRRETNILKIEKPIHLKLVRIPQGEFNMGNNPMHRVFVSEFYISKYPVTNEKYFTFVNEANYEVPEHWKDGAIPTGKAKHPVVYISFKDAITFCQWLSEATARSFRLPTEDEWEKAARGMDGRIYPWGNEWDKKRLNSKERGVNDTTPVGIFSPAGDSPYSLVDMCGNVAEWCLDVLLKKDNATHQVLRGGSFLNYSDQTNCTYHKWCNPVLRYRDNGFRVVLSE